MRECSIEEGRTRYAPKRNSSYFVLLFICCMSTSAVPDVLSVSARRARERRRDMLRGRDREREVQREARRLVDTYGDLAMRLAYTYLGSRQDAEDVSQDVLCKLIARHTPLNCVLSR